MTLATYGVTLSQGAEQDRALIDSPLILPDQSLSYLSDLSILFLSFCLLASPPKHPSLKEVQLVIG